MRTIKKITFQWKFPLGDDFDSKASDMGLTPPFAEITGIFFNWRDPYKGFVWPHLALYYNDLREEVYEGHDEDLPDGESELVAVQEQGIEGVTLVRVEDRLVRAVLREFYIYIKIRFIFLSDILCHIFWVTKSAQRLTWHIFSIAVIPYKMKIIFI